MPPENFVFGILRNSLKNMACISLRSFQLLLRRHAARCYCAQAQTITNTNIRKKRNEIFENEKKRQLSLITRLEKIKVEHKGPPEDCTLIMNKGLSTPFNCAMHIQELLMKRSVLALVNGQPWDLHRPLVEDCELSFLHFRDDDPSLSNQTFWRSCSFILGHILETAFKEDFLVELCSFPPPNVRSGSMVYDANLNLGDWKPSQDEINCLSRIGYRLHLKDYKIERLDVDATVALSIFENNRFKLKQIPQIAAHSVDGNAVTVYRMGDHIDISRGPMMASTALLGRFEVSSIHSVESSDYGPLSRIQGLAIPSQLVMHPWTFGFLLDRTKQLNKSALPSLHQYKEIRSEQKSTPELST